MRLDFVVVAGDAVERLFGFCCVFSGRTSFWSTPVTGWQQARAECVVLVLRKRKKWLRKRVDERAAGR